MFTFPATFMSSEAGGGIWTDYDATNDKTPVVFSTSAIQNPNVIPIDDTRAMLVYRGQSFYCRARVASIDVDGVVTFGTEAVLLSATVQWVKADLLDSSHIVVSVASGGDAKALVFAFSGTTIGTVGAAVSFETCTLQNMSVAKLSSTDFMIAYNNSTSGKSRAYYGTVSGTTVTAQSGLDFSSSTNVDCNMTNLTSTNAVIVAGTNVDTSVNAFLMSVSANTPVIDDTLVLIGSGVSGDSVGVIRVSDTEIIASYSDQLIPDCQAVVVTESGGTLSKGTIETFATVDAEEMSIALPNDNQAVITYAVNNVGVSTAVLEKSGTSLTTTALTPVSNITGDKEFVTNGQVSDNFVLIAYEDDNNLSQGTVIVARP
jgi:hypothetical protein